MALLYLTNQVKRSVFASLSYKYFCFLTLFFTSSSFVHNTYKYAKERAHTYCLKNLFTSPYFSEFIHFILQDFWEYGENDMIHHNRTTRIRAERVDVSVAVWYTTGRLHLLGFEWMWEFLCWRLKINLKSFQSVRGKILKSFRLLCPHKGCCKCWHEVLIQLICKSASTCVNLYRFYSLRHVQRSHLWLHFITIMNTKLVWMRPGHLGYLYGRRSSFFRFIQNSTCEKRFQLLFLSGWTWRCERTAAAVTALMDSNEDDEWTEMDIITTCLVVFFAFFSYQLQPVHICSVVIYNQSIYSINQ